VLAVHRVRSGDTLFEIAQAYDVSVDDLLLANAMTEDDVYTIQPGDDLNIPAPTPEGAAPAAAVAAATATPAPATYTVRAGDTLMAIALRLGIEVEDLLDANDMTINDARTLQPGDELVLPGAEGLATPAATATATSTPGTPTAVPTVAATAASEPQSAVRLDAPRLRAPENGTAVSCSAENVLIWLPVGSMRSTDLYLLHLGYVDGAAADSSEQVVWVITQPRPAGTTSWTLDNDLCGLAPSTSGKQWRWYVEVVERTSDGYLPVSAPSALWGFAWQ
jgi:LysM repeat protein